MVDKAEAWIAALRSTGKFPRCASKNRPRFAPVHGQFAVSVG
jgi:hypothetical protein